MHAPFRTLAGLFLLVVCVVCFLCATFGPVRAQSKPSERQALTQQQIDGLVNAISAAVVEKLKKDGSIPAKPAEPASAGEPDQDLAAERVTDFAARAEVLLSSYPELWRNLTRIPLILDKSEGGGRGLGALFAMLGIAVAAALGSDALLRQALDPIRRRLVA
jgi:hypothetical protein